MPRGQQAPDRLSAQDTTQLPPAILLMGPTASGKTGIAVDLAQDLPVEIISVDSALVYRDMNIGTAKPDAATLVRAPHRLIDIRDPTESYSAAAFRHDALQLMQNISNRGKIPMLVGGTMLYFRALLHGLSNLPEADPAIRAELDAEIARVGINAVHQRLAEVDAETAARLDPNDRQRIQRALEIYRITGQPMSLMLERKTADVLPYQVIPVALIPSTRTVLHQRIGHRYGEMLEMGLVEELISLKQRYQLHPELPSMRCVGYRQAWQYLDGTITREQLLDTGIAATRQLAKRQLTWLRSMPGNIEIDCLASNLTQKVHSAITDELDRLRHNSRLA
jgi:tRNA dimethylallyltransferase